jgi:flagellar biosynthesis protein FlhF
LETKRFIGNDTTRLFARIRRELGPDAVILSTRSLHREGATSLIEIIAAPPPEPADALPLHLQQALLQEALRRVETAPGVTIADLDELAAAERDASPPPPPAFTPAPPSPLPTREGAIIAAYCALGWDAPAARAVLDAAPAARDAREALETWLSGCIAAYPPEGATALVTIQGPEGSGRSTALLKMALDCADAGRPAALVAADSARAGAHAAIRACADALDLPCHDVFAPADLVRVTARAPRGTCLFVDCPAGAWVPPPIPGVAHFAYLAIPAHWHPAAFRAAIEELPLARFSGAVLAATDLAPSLAGALQLLAESGLGLAFLSSGRDIAQGIALADPAAIAASLFAAPVDWQPLAATA